MMDNEFEAAFSCFLERHECDDAESALFEIVRAAFPAARRAVSARRRSGFFKFWAAPKKIPGINKKILISA